MQFARLSKSGRYVVGEGPGADGPCVLLYDRALNTMRRVAESGISPDWVVDDAVVGFVAGSRLLLYDVGLREQTELTLPRAANKFAANGAGQWVAWHGAAPVGYTAWDGGSGPTDNWPAIDRAGAVHVCADGQQFIRFADGLSAWVLRTSPPSVGPVETWGKGESHWSVPLQTPLGPCVLCVEDARLVLRLGATGKGWVLATEPTYHPDARWDGTQVLWVATDRHGELIVRALDIRAVAPVALDPEPVPVPERPSLTFSGYGPEEGTVPFEVRALLRQDLSGHRPVTRVVLRARLDGGTAEVTAEAPALPATLAVRLEQPGTWLLTATAEGPGGPPSTTGKRRPVRALARPEPPPPDPTPTPPPGPPESQPDAPWDAYLEEASLLPPGTSLRYALAWGRLRSYGRPDATACAPLSRAEAWRELWPTTPFPGTGPRKFPAVVGLVWPLSGGERVALSPSWLATFKAAGFTSVRIDVPTERERENAADAVRAVLRAGLTPLPILTWPYRHPDAADIVAYGEWFAGLFPDLPAIEIGNEPWVLAENGRITGAEFLHCAAPLVERLEQLTTRTKLVVAYDRWDHSSGRARNWPGWERVRDFIAAGPRRYAAVHNYRNPKPPSWSGWGTRKQEHAAIVGDLGHARVWFTEFGWKPQEGAAQASGDYHVEELATLGDLGVEAAYVYTHTADHENKPFDFGLWDAATGDLAPRPAATRIAAALREASAPWLPTRAQVADWNGGIAYDRDNFSPFCLSFSEERWRAFIARTKQLKLTHVIVMLSGEYRGRFSWFWLWDDVPAVRRRLRELLDARLIPVLWAANGESFRARQLGVDATDAMQMAALDARVRRGMALGRGADVVRREGGPSLAVEPGVPLNVLLTGAYGFQRDTARSAAGRSLESVWRQVLPQLSDLLPAAVPAPEMNDIWTPAEQHSRTLLLRELLPSAYLATHLTRGRCHGDHNRGTGPAGEPPKEWRPEPDPNNPGHLRAGVVGYYAATPVDACFYNIPYEHLEDEGALVDDLGDVSVRVNGRVPVPGKTAPYPGVRRDVIAGEFAAEWVLRGDWTWERGASLRRAARRVPGITGTGD